jgi:predicted transposase
MNHIIPLSCKLNIVQQQREHLEETLRAFADTCNWIWTYGIEQQTSQQWALHQGCYKTIRKMYGIPASLAIRAIARVAIDLRLRKSGTFPYSPNFIAFDSRSFMLHQHDWSVGLTLLKGREKFHLDIAGRQQKLLEDYAPASAVLVTRYRSFYLEFTLVGKAAQVNQPVRQTNLVTAPALKR